MKKIEDRRPSEPSLSGEHRRGPILCVEDEADNYNAMDHRLGARYELLWARSDAEAARLLRDHGTALRAILMDIQLQGSTLDGIELTRAIRSIGPRVDAVLPEIPVLQDVPIIFVTGCIGKYTAEELKQSGGNALVGKPIDFHELTQILEHFVHVD